MKRISYTENQGLKVVLFFLDVPPSFSVASEIEIKNNTYGLQAMLG